MRKIPQCDTRNTDSCQVGGLSFLVNGTFFACSKIILYICSVCWLISFVSLLESKEIPPF